MWTAILRSKKSLAAGRHTEVNTGPGATNTICEEILRSDIVSDYEMTLEATSLC
jgi:hypothetical protein